jgi:transcriptional regulator with XRE-family HTH domain
MAVVARSSSQRVTNSVSDFLKELREERPGLKEAWDETALARTVALTLVRMRHEAELTQGLLAKAANWDKSYVSRLESATCGVPDLATIARYARACKLTISLVAVRPGKKIPDIISALPLAESSASHDRGSEPSSEFAVAVPFMEGDDARDAPAAEYSQES